MNKNKFLTFSAVVICVVMPALALAAVTEPCVVIEAFQDIFTKAAAAIVIIGWIITGILYLTAAGDPSKLKLAQGALVACVIGTAVVILAPMAYGFVDGALNLGSGDATTCNSTTTPTGTNNEQ